MMDIPNRQFFPTPCTARKTVLWSCHIVSSTVTRSLRRSVRSKFLYADMLFLEALFLPGTLNCTEMVNFGGRSLCSHEYPGKDSHGGMHNWRIRPLYGPQRLFRPIASSSLRLPNLSLQIPTMDFKLSIYSFKWYRIKGEENVWADCWPVSQCPNKYSTPFVHSGTNYSTSSTEDLVS